MSNTLMSSAAHSCGTMVNGGPLFGINGIVRFETGTAYDAEYGAEYTTVYGVSRDNEKFNLMEAVWNTAPLSIPSMIGSFVSEDTGTWFEICEDQPNFYTGAYTNGQRIPAHGTAASPTLVWMTAAGSALFRCSVWIQGVRSAKRWL